MPPNWVSTYYLVAAWRLLVGFECNVKKLVKVPPVKFSFVDATVSTYDLSVNYLDSVTVTFPTYPDLPSN